MPRAGNLHRLPRPIVCGEQSDRLVLALQAGRERRPVLAPDHLRRDRRAELRDVDVPPAGDAVDVLGLSLGPAAGRRGSSALRSRLVSFFSRLHLARNATRVAPASRQKSRHRPQNAHHVGRPVEIDQHARVGDWLARAARPERLQVIPERGRVRLPVARERLGPEDDRVAASIMVGRGALPGGSSPRRAGRGAPPPSLGAQGWRPPG